MTRSRTYADYRAERYFAPLDGVRAIAVLLVVFVHARGGWHWLGGWNGVTMFFVLSGFLITTLALREEDRVGSLDRGAFYLRRCFRILPLYVVALSLFVVADLGAGLASAGGRSRLADALPYYFSPVPEIPHFFGHGGPFEIAWSLGIEEKFYLLWPLLAFGALALRGSFRRRLTLTLALLAASEAPLFFSDAGRAFAPYGSILIGCALALLLHRPGGFARLSALARPVPFAAALGLLLAVQALTPMEPQRLQGLYAVLVALVLAGLVTGTPVAARLLSTRPLRFLGRLSYGLYLVHSLGLNVAAALVPARFGEAGNLAALVLGLVLAVGLAYVLHRLVEKPMIALGRRVVADRTTPLMVPTQAAPSLP